MHNDFRSYFNVKDDKPPAEYKSLNTLQDIVCLLFKQHFLKSNVDSFDLNRIAPPLLSHLLLFHVFDMFNNSALKP